MKKKNRTAAMILAAIMAVGVTGCASVPDSSSPDSSAPENSSKAESASDGTFTLGFSNRLDSDPWMIDFKNRLMELDDADDSIEILYADADGNDQKQVEQIDNFFVQGIDGLIIIPNNGAAVVDSLDQAEEKGIPVAAISTAPDDGTFDFIGCSHYDCGYAQGEYCAEILPKGAKVLYLGGDTSFQISVDRKEGFYDGLGSRADDIEILAEQECDYTMEDGMTKMEDWIQTFPDFDAVVAVNDQSALGAIEAMKGANKLEGKVICGIDCLDIAVDSIKAGEMSMTVLQDPRLHADKAVEALKAHLEGGSVPEDLTIPITAVTKDNVNEIE